MRTYTCTYVCMYSIFRSGCTNCSGSSVKVTLRYIKCVMSACASPYYTVHVWLLMYSTYVVRMLFGNKFTVLLCYLFREILTDQIILSVVSGKHKEF